MLSLCDFMGCSNLHDSVIKAIATNQQVPLQVAVLMGEILLQTTEGLCEIHRMVAEDIQKAIDENDLARAQVWAATYKWLEECYPLPGQSGKIETPNK